MFVVLLVFRQELHLILPRCSALETIHLVLLGVAINVDFVVCKIPENVMGVYSISR
jgi:hypothetical protein